MNSDITVLLKDTICTTFETNLSKDISLVDTFQATTKNIENLNIIQLDASFSFESITINIKFLLPAYISSYIFNIMMMEDAQPSLEVDDDIADAIKEIVSQISGGLETAINAAGYEDLGSTKFSVGDYKIIKGSEYEISNKFILLKFLIEDSNYELYLDIDEVSLPYFEELVNSKELETESENIDLDIDGLTIDEEELELLEEDIILEELEPLEEDTTLEELTDDLSEDESTEKKQESIVEEKKDETTIQNDQEDEDIKNKDKKLKLMIIIVAGILVTVIIAFLVSYFMGVFDSEPIVRKDINKTKTSKQSLIIANIKNKQIDFKMELINTKRLNKRLSILTKYEILEEDALEKFKQMEKDRLFKLKMKRLEEFALNNTEESLKFNDKTNKNISKQDRFLDKNKLYNSDNTIIDNDKLTFIQISSLKYKKYKDIINEEKPKKIRTSICQNDEGKIDVYIGPIYIKLIINNIMKKIKRSSKKQKDVKIINLTKLQFDKRCDF